MMTPKLEPIIRKKIPCSKLKLQLFPINDNTRQGLEKDGYYPFLELTLSARKKISSVIKHLHTKWGSSSIAVGQLILFPYTIKLEQLPSCRRWGSNDGAITAWEVYLAVKTPSPFRLRYGWWSNHHLQVCDIPPKCPLLEDHIDCAGNNCSQDLDINNGGDKIDDGHKSGQAQQQEENMMKSLLSDVKELKALDVPNDHMDDKVATDVTPLQSMEPWGDSLADLSIGGLLSDISLLRKISGSHDGNMKESAMMPNGQISNLSIASLFSEASLGGKIGNPDMNSENNSTLQPIVLTPSDISIGGLLSETSMLSNKRKLDTQSMEGRLAQLQSPWDGSFTTLSIGGLLSASWQSRAGLKQEREEGKSNLQPSTSLPDSFDAFVAAQLNADSQALKSASHESRSILDAEDTCHAFPFQQSQSFIKDAPTSNIASGCSSSTNSKLFRFPKIAKTNTETGLVNDISCQGLKTNSTLGSLRTIDEDSCLGIPGTNLNESQNLPGDGGDDISLSEYVR